MISGMKKEAGRNLLGQTLILLITVAWGSSFIILKHAIENSPALYIIGLRFSVSGICMAAIFFKKIATIDKTTLLCGLMLGITLTIAYMTQTLGLKYISAGKNAFLTSLYCVVIPFLQWAIFKDKPKSYNVISAFLCVTGFAFVAFSGTGETERNELLGSALTVVCAVFYAFQIIFSGKYQERGCDTLQLLIVQFLTVGVLTLGVSFIFELPVYGIESFAISKSLLLPLSYLTFVCTLLAQVGQMVGIKLTSPAQASLILAFEAVFGAIFSIISGDEILNGYLVAGFLIIFAGTMISELKPNFLKIFRKKPKNNSENPPSDG